MAWLITLALFLVVGGGIAKFIDAERDKQYLRSKRPDIAPNEYYANIYVLAWNYYQILEPQVLRAYAKEKPNIPGANIPGSSGMSQFSEKAFGEDLQLLAVKKALLELESKKAIQLDRTDKVKVQTLAEEALANIPNLGYFYNWGTAALTTTSWIKHNIPRNTDSRTYRAGTLVRTGTPRGYPDAIDTHDGQKYEYNL